MITTLHKLSKLIDPDIHIFANLTTDYNQGNEMMWQPNTPTTPGKVLFCLIWFHSVGFVNLVLFSFDFIDFLFSFKHNMFVLVACV